MQGESGGTIKKEALFSTCIGFVLKYVKSTELYLAADINAGRGYNEKAGCRGSPAILIDQIDKHKQRAMVWLCDEDQEAELYLKARFGLQNGFLFPTISRRTVEIVRADNANFLGMLAMEIPKRGETNPKGIIIADDNGLHCPVQAIAAVTKRYPRIDLLIHLKSLKEQRAYWAKYPKGAPTCPIKRPGEDVVMDLRKMLNQCHKNTWLISEPFGNGRKSFVLFGTNLRVIRPVLGLPGRPNMHRHDSPEGRALIEDMSDGLASVC